MESTLSSLSNDALSLILFQPITPWLFPAASFPALSILMIRFLIKVKVLCLKNVFFGKKLLAEKKYAFGKKIKKTVVFFFKFI